MFKFGSLRAICTSSLLLSAGFFQSCVLPSDEPGGGGGAPSGGSDSTAGSSDGGSISGTGAVAGVGGATGGGTGALGGTGESGGGGAGTLGGSAGSSAGTGESGGGTGGVVGGVGGSMGGTPESAGGVAGSMLNIGGCSNYGGSNSAGWPGQAGQGGSNVAGSEASGGAAAAGNGGQGGVAFAGASGSAGACSDSSCAGMSGGAGAPSGAGSGGTGGDPSLPLVLSSNLINFPATECGTTPTSKTLTITNPSSVSKTWRAVPAGAFSFLADPTGSSLAPGGVVTVTVTPPFVPLRSQPSNSSQLMTGVLLIVDGASYQPVTLSEPIAGAFYSWTPANLNFGTLALNTSATRHLTQSGDSSGRALSDNPAFSGTYSATSWHEWTFTFNATTIGTQTATFTWISVPYHLAPCTPDTFTATAYVQQ